MKLIDTHCHLDFKDFEADFKEVVLRTQDQLELVVNAASSISSNTKILKMIQEYPFIYGTLGLHPHDAKEFTPEFLEFIKSHLSTPKIVAVGEIGLDYYKNYSPRDVQKEVFTQLAKMAINRNKPIVIHSREAISDTLDILAKLNAKDVVFHCFTGTFKESQQILEQGYLISFSGVITYKNKELEKVAQTIPLDRFFLETDAPFLAPTPLRGKRNEPTHVQYAAQKMALLKNLSLEEVILAANTNAKRFFRI